MRLLRLGVRRLVVRWERRINRPQRAKALPAATVPLDRTPTKALARSQTLMVLASAKLVGGGVVAPRTIRFISNC